MNRPETFDLDLASDMRVTQGQLGEFMYADEANAFMDSQQSKLEGIEKEVARLKRVEEFVECTGRARAVMDRAEAAEARVRELESQLEAAKVEGSQP